MSSLNNNPRHSPLQNSAAKGLCWVMLLYGNPALALPISMTPRPWVSEWAARAGQLVGRLDPSSLIPTINLPSLGREHPSQLPQQVEPVTTASLAGNSPLGLLFQQGWGSFSVGQDPSLPRTPPAPPGRKAPQPARDASLALEGLESKSALDAILVLPGWNLLSLPEEPVDSDPGSVLSAISGAYEAAYSYDACDPADPWKVHDPGDPAGSNLTAIDHKIGFWLDATQPVELPSEGTLPATTAFTFVSAGI